MRVPPEAQRALEAIGIDEVKGHFKQWAADAPPFCPYLCIMRQRPRPASPGPDQYAIRRDLRVGNILNPDIMRPVEHGSFHALPLLEKQANNGLEKEKSPEASQGFYIL